MSEFLHHIPCLNCGSRDNRGVWDDGHEYCFGCRDYLPPSKWKELQGVGQSNRYSLGSPFGGYSNRICDLPSDFSNSIPPLASTWLRQYITQQEILNHGIGYSVGGVRLRKRGITLSPLLVLPVWGGNKELVAWQGRYFGTEKDYPKYYTKLPDPSALTIIGSQLPDPVVVVVEDIVSGIKVSRVADAMPLLGSFLSKEKAVSLSKMYKHLYLWLDYDKAKESIKQAGQVAQFFDSVKPIITEQDPKAYETDEIKKFLQVS